MPVCMCTCVFVCALRKKTRSSSLCTFGGYVQRAKEETVHACPLIAWRYTHNRRRISYLEIVQRRVHGRKIYIIRSDTLTERLFGLGATTCTERGPVVRKHSGQRNENSEHTCAQRRDDCKNFRRGRVGFFFFF